MHNSTTPHLSLQRQINSSLRKNDLRNQLKYGTKSEHERKFFSGLDAKTIERLRKLYELDFEMYDYNFKDYMSNKVQSFKYFFLLLSLLLL